MKALLKTGTWVEIKTTYLFHDQYNTADGERIFDKDISRIVDDVRDGLGHCKYCGAIIRRGEEEAHFAEMECKQCKDCSWLRERVVNREIKRDERTEGNTRTTTRTTVETLAHVCSYKERYPESGCTNREHRRMGIEWFTPENTFFLRYPDGFTSIPEVDKLEARGFVLMDRCVSAEYYKKLGSYTLEAVLTYTDGKASGISHYRLWNTRKHFNFIYADGSLYCDQYAFGWRNVKTLQDVPASVMAAVKAICCR